MRAVHYGTIILYNRLVRLAIKIFNESKILFGGKGSNGKERCSLVTRKA